MTLDLRLTASSLGLALLLACGGGGGGGSTPSTPPPQVVAQGLDYTNPATSTFRLVKNTQKSTPSLLVLDLEANAAPAMAGIACVLSGDVAKTSWMKVDSTDSGLVQAGAFPMSEAVVLAKAVGNDLQVGLFQKAGKPLAATGTVVLGRIALSLKSGQSITANTPMVLSIPAGKARILNPAGTTAVYTDIQVAVGNLFTR